MTRRTSLFLALAVLAACGGESSNTLAPDSDAPLLKKVDGTPPGLSAEDQALMDAYMEGRTTGAFVNRDVCALFSYGFFDENGAFLGFSLFIPESCPAGFERQNPDGTIDQHVSSSGLMLLVLPPFGAFFGSEGSDVHWTIKSSEDGRNVLNVNGTLSDGSRVKGHFNQNATSGKLWVEGLGYVVGSPGK
jgi:hypothetical protein